MSELLIKNTITGEWEAIPYIVGPQGPQGEKGDTGLRGVDGITPHIGENGNWHIGETDTGMPSRGEDAPQEAILYTPQSLTHEQQAQARENIGAVGISDLPGAETGGLTIAQVNALNELFRAAAYTIDVSDKYAAFRKAFGLESGDEPVNPDEPDVPVITTYNITNNLTGVINSNSATTVNEGDAYTATLTIEDDYILNSIVITMGGEDITANVYGDGYVLIANVSGDIVITAIAEKPQYIPTTANSYVDIIDFYSGEQDDVSAKIANKSYTRGVFYTTVVPETDTEVTVRLLNNTETDASADCYVGATHTPGGTKAKIYYSQAKYKGTVRANGNVEFKYVVPAGKYLCVSTGNANIDAEIVGNYTIHQPVAEYEMAKSSYNSYAWYADGTTENLKTKGNYNTFINSVNVFEEDTPLRITIVGDGTFKGSIMAGSRLDNKDGNAYYTDGYGGFTNKIPEGGMAVHYYTVRAGHHLTVDNTNGTIYVERA